MPEANPLNSHGPRDRLRKRLAPEVIGVPECPLMHRWTIASCRAGKLLVHHFLPTQRDRDPHDHPRPFVTLVVRGGYDDIQPSGHVDRVRAPAIRARRAEHAHITVAGARGAWTVVLMGPLRREWGFVRDGRWWPWRRYEERFGLAFRCEPPEPAGRAVSPSAALNLPPD